MAVMGPRVSFFFRGVFGSAIPATSSSATSVGLVWRTVRTSFYAILILIASGLRVAFRDRSSGQMRRSDPHVENGRRLFVDGFRLQGRALGIVLDLIWQVLTYSLSIHLSLVIAGAEPADFIVNPGIKLIEHFLG